jgi:hypothetical protein
MCSFGDEARRRTGFGATDRELAVVPDEARAVAT